MKGTLLGGLVASALVAGAGVGEVANAADMSVKAPAYVAPGVYDWSGFYIGLNAGYAAGRATQDPSTVAPNCTGPACPALVALLSTSSSMSSSAFTGGFEAGANLQLGSWVVGLEGDIEAFHLRSSFAIGPVKPVATFPASVTGSGSVSTDWLATIRPRVGVAFDRWLVYGTGGVAFTNETDSFSDTVTATGGGPFTGSIGMFNGTSSRDVGWTVGAGVEYAVAGQWTLKAEYLHVDVGSVSASAGATNLPPPPPSGLTGAVMTTSSRLTADIGRVGLNYRF